MEPPDETWHSGVEAAVEYFDDRWVMEIRLPRAIWGIPVIAIAGG